MEAVIARISAGEQDFVVNDVSLDHYLELTEKVSTKMTYDIDSRTLQIFGVPSNEHDMAVGVVMQHCADAVRPRPDPGGVRLAEVLAGRVLLGRSYRNPDVSLVRVDGRELRRLIIEVVWSSPRHIYDAEGGDCFLQTVRQYFEGGAEVAELVAVVGIFLTPIGADRRGVAGAHAVTWCRSGGSEPLVAWPTPPFPPPFPPPRAFAAVGSVATPGAVVPDLPAALFPATRVVEPAVVTIPAANVWVGMAPLADVVINLSEMVARCNAVVARQDA